MTNLRRVIVLILISMLAAACEPEGPAERAGEKIDEAYEEVREAGEDLGNEVEDACEELKDEAGAEDKDC